MPGLRRFKDAQEDPASGFAAALAELRAGGKRGHWIWYVFPQLAGLGRSSAAEHYAIADEAEATAYLRDPVLRGRLLAVTAAVAQLLRAGQPLTVTMGSSIDTLKLISSLTLFEAVADRLRDDPANADLARFQATATEILDAAKSEGYSRCRFTQTRLAGTPQV